LTPKFQILCNDPINNFSVSLSSTHLSLSLYLHLFTDSPDISLQLTILFLHLSFLSVRNFFNTNRWLWSQYMLRVLLRNIDEAMDFAYLLFFIFFFFFVNFTYRSMYCMLLVEDDKCTKQVLQDGFGLVKWGVVCRCCWSLSSEATPNMILSKKRLCFFGIFWRVVLTCVFRAYVNKPKRKNFL